MEYIFYEDDEIEDIPTEPSLDTSLLEQKLEQVTDQLALAMAEISRLQEELVVAREEKPSSPTQWMFNVQRDAEGLITNVIAHSDS